ncbi:hypothetical protein [Mucilaginibacter terrae]|uniref:Tetratricopeptide (TPR) repeat protein n=1 Tax=Mucilaginibacter terrae TaxID=1955052 RepID=A0ABU3GYB4_9SPHI|nr:hypothetical protein [Mucilaginibacter terrae]MDT3404591.1 tetratricopeptide (TPR) repeat protein [Mucilaginibacter terrae]
MLLFFCSVGVTASAQNADSLFNVYTDFNLARFQDESLEAFRLGEVLLPKADKLPEKARVSFYNSLAKLYEDNSQFERALPLYEKVAVARPDYYVVHLALGHIYLRQAEALETKDKAVYTALVNKIIPHLEKVQACDPYDENLTLIKKLYHNINNDAGFATLNTRLKTLKNKCLDILEDH